MIRLRLLHKVLQYKPPDAHRDPAFRKRFQEF